MSRLSVSCITHRRWVLGASLVLASTTPALSRPAALTRAGSLQGGHTARLPAPWHFAAEYLLLLPVGVGIALVWANTHAESYFRTVFALDFFVTRVAMVLFFGLVAKEVVEALLLGFRLPHHVGWRELVVVGVISSNGFAMALFFATVAVGPGAVLSGLESGALFTVLGVPLALLLARLLKVGRFGGRRSNAAAG